MKVLEELAVAAKIKELMKDRESTSKKVLWALAIIGAIAAVAGIAFAVYKLLAPDYLEDDFDDDFDDDFFDDDLDFAAEDDAPAAEEEAPVEEAAPEEEAPVAEDEAE